MISIVEMFFFLYCLHSIVYRISFLLGDIGSDYKYVVSLTFSKMIQLTINSVYRFLENTQIKNAYFSSFLVVFIFNINLFIKQKSNQIPATNQSLKKKKRFSSYPVTSCRISAAFRICISYGQNS